MVRSNKVIAGDPRSSIVGLRERLAADRLLPLAACGDAR